MGSLLVQGHAGVESLLTVPAVRALVMTVALAAASAYLLRYFDQGGIPHDLGALGHSAERVLRGDMPHRDFISLYSGGLSRFHALAFYLFGISTTSMRAPLLISSLAFLIVLYLLARRTASRPGALLIVATALAWSVPNYFVSMPTWYNLFLHATGVYALFRYMESERRGWLFGAGVCGGLSFAVKSIALFYVAAVLLYLTFRSQQASVARPRQALDVLLSVGITLGLAAFAGLVAALMGTRLRAPELVVLAWPCIALAVSLAAHEWVRRPTGGVRRLQSLGTETGVFVAGCGVPVLMLLAPYLIEGSVTDWMRGVFVTPRMRLFESDGGLVETRWGWGFMTAAALLAAPVVLPERFRSAVGGAVIGVMALVVLCGANADVYVVVWRGFRAVIPLLATVAAVLPFVGGSLKLSRLQMERSFLVVAVAAMMSLVQFPVGHAIYFLYVAPLALLAASTVLLTMAPRGTPSWSVVMAGLLLFGLTWIGTGTPIMYGKRYAERGWTVPIVTVRSPVRVDPESAALYSRLIQVVQQHTREGEPILALPDAPHVYFFTGRTNPTPTLFDCFDPDYGTPAREARLLKTIDERKVRLVVIRHQGVYSTAAPSPHFETGLLARFPSRLTFTDAHDNSPLYTVLWRDTPQLAQNVRRP